MDKKDINNPLYHGAFMFNERLDVIFRNINEAKIINSSNWSSNYQLYLYLLNDLISELSVVMTDEQKNEIIGQYKEIRKEYYKLKGSANYNNIPTGLEYSFMDLEIKLRDIMHKKGLLIKYDDMQGSEVFK